MLEIDLMDARGSKLDARVEIGASQIILHSRSNGGEHARNPDYRKALEIIFERLDEEYITPDTFLDSALARRRKTSLEQRRLVGAEEIFITPKEFASEVIKRSNAGSNSHGAWRRLRMQVPPVPDYALQSIIDGTVLGRRPGGISADRQRKVERRHVDAAIAEIRSGNGRHTRFGNSTGWLLYPDDGGEPLAPKLVFGIALAEALKTHTTPNDFASGNTFFEMLRGLGFEVRHYDDPPPQKRNGAGRTQSPMTTIPPTAEELEWIEGNPRIARHLIRERSGTMPGQFRASFRVEHGKLFCQRCDRDYLDVYDGPEIAEACFEVHHTIPVSQMQKNHRTTFEQLQLLCANCHRAEHREMALAAK